MGSQNNPPLTRIVFWLASLASLWLLFNLVAMPLAWGGESATEGLLGAIQLVILLGFLLVILFDLFSLLWLALKARARTGGTGLTGLHVLGLCALVGMMGAKVMVDEIARETPLGRAGGEWGMLYAFLVLQLAYLLVILFRAKSEGR